MEELSLGVKSSSWALYTDGHPNGGAHKRVWGSQRKAENGEARALTVQHQDGDYCRHHKDRSILRPGGYRGQPEDGRP